LKSTNQITGVKINQSEEMDFLGKIIKTKKSPKELVAATKSLVSTVSIEVIAGTVNDKDSKGQKVTFVPPLKF
jgi:hypothetical protein